MFNIGVTIPLKYEGRDFERINKSLVLDYFASKSKDEKSLIVLYFIKINEQCLIHSLYNIYRRDPDWLLTSIFINLSNFFPRLHPDKIGNRNPLYAIKWVYADVKQDLSYENNFGFSKKKPWGDKAWSPKSGITCGSFDEIGIDIAYIDDMPDDMAPVGLAEGEIPEGKNDVCI